MHLNGALQVMSPICIIMLLFSVLLSLAPWQLIKKNLLDDIMVSFIRSSF